MVLRPAAILFAAALLAGACNAKDERAPVAERLSTTPCGTYDGHGCAPPGGRVDLTRPSFTHPTEIDNPLFPISKLRSAVLLGHVDDKPFRTETTLLPGTSTVTWNGEKIEVLVSQYMAYLDGHLDEVALDRYAQADDGSVWYLGEDVFDYRDGTVALTEGTWLAGRDGPGAMIMPAHPSVGDVYRTENAPGIVFEEVTVTSTTETVEGPRGPVSGAMIARELHSDGTSEDKIFAPGYGEFRTAGGGDLEALAEAIPTDAAAEPLPAELPSLFAQAGGVLEAARLDEWEGASATVEHMNAAWTSLGLGDQPRMVVDRLSNSLATLGRAVRARSAPRAEQAAIDLSQSVLDLQLRYRPAAQIDAARFYLWTQQLRVDAASKKLDAATGDVAALEWIRDRFAPMLPAGRAELDARLAALRGATDAANLPAAADHAARLGARVRALVDG
jgi:hypothetical protein